MVGLAAYGYLAAVPYRMPYAIHREPERAVTVIEVSGEVPGHEVAAALGEVAADPRTETCRHLLWDFSRMTSLVVLPEHVTQVLQQQERVEARTGPARVAIVSTHVDIPVMAYLLERSRPDARREFRLFGTLADARAWLDEVLPAGPVGR